MTPVFVLSHKRPSNIATLATLQKTGKTSNVFIVVDDEDPTCSEYIDRYGDRVKVFSKKKYAGTFDACDNFNNYRGVIYARNAVFDIAKDLGFEFFIVLDDDYKMFQFRFDKYLNYRPKAIKQIEPIFKILVDALRSMPAVDSIAIAQGGDFIGGEENQNAKAVKITRKLMNLFVCATDRRFEFMGRINEDVNVYTNLGARGRLFFTTSQLTLEQAQTQKQSGGMTGLYLDHGTYVKSFYSVILQPGCVKVGALRDRQGARCHHAVTWNNCVPKILRPIKSKSELLNG
jgi:hypothetical protein